ncbi:MAG TPA: hypothetical protein VKZ78_07155 [Sphingobacteriaceae bacterium]|nr:hypothetical protein [Sphingobacteriaceae bacterium]
MVHSFHIPVLGLAFSIDTPLKVAHYGITSVVSIVDDELIERMREFHCGQSKIPYIPISKNEPDFRAKRITAYLNMLDLLVIRNTEALRIEQFGIGKAIDQYFEFLPENSILKALYLEMQSESDPIKKDNLQLYLRSQIQAGSVEVNIMSKVDKVNMGPKNEPLSDQFSDAMAALRGAANSTLQTSVVLSAGLNPRLYSYLADFQDFKPDQNGLSKKKIILKVSDYRSALIQAKILAKKGIWVSEFRIESGLNCGGHAFATDGFLLGPILEEFKTKREEFLMELGQVYQKAINSELNSDASHPHKNPTTRITVQGGIGTSTEHQFLINYYELDGAGWGSPFLLVPDATNVDSKTLSDLTTATADDYYVSGASPLGVPFNNFRKSSAEQQRLERIAKGRPGSPCTKKYLVSNTEFTSEPICTASRKYQHRKIKQLQAASLEPHELQRQLNEVLEKTCLCEGLATSAYLKNDLLKPKENPAVAICPGPNLAWFNRTYSLKEMIDHIYGRINLLQQEYNRPNLFINELDLYVKHLKKFVDDNRHTLNEKKEKYISKFKNQLNEGIRYYEYMYDHLSSNSPIFSKQMLLQLEIARKNLE